MPVVGTRLVGAGLGASTRWRAWATHDASNGGRATSRGRATHCLPRSARTRRAPHARGELRQLCPSCGSHALHATRQQLLPGHVPHRWHGSAPHTHWCDTTREAIAPAGRRRRWSARSAPLGDDEGAAGPKLGLQVRGPPCAVPARKKKTQKQQKKKGARCRRCGVATDVHLVIEKRATALRKKASRRACARHPHRAPAMANTAVRYADDAGAAAHPAQQSPAP